MTDKWKRQHTLTDRELERLISYLLTFGIVWPFRIIELSLIVIAGLARFILSLILGLARFIFSLIPAKVNYGGLTFETGYVYVLSNPSMPGIIKIGMTERDVESRVRELNATTGVPTPFRIEYKHGSPDPRLLERKLHHELRRCRVNNNREFFKVDPATVKEKIRSLER